MLAVRLTRPGLALLAIVFALTIMTRGTGALCQTRSASAPRSPGAHASPRPAPSAQLVGEGIAAFERGDEATARELLARALAADPRNPETHTYLGAIADRAGDLVTAEHHFAAAARLAPQSASARNNHGAVLLRLSRAREAAAEFEASLRLNAQQANALVNLARLRFDINTPEGLRSAAELFLRADALAPDAEIARALTVIALRRHESARAASHYRAYAARLAAASDTPANAAARTELGGALFEAGLLDEAQAELTAALALDPNDVDAVVRLARVYLARKDTAAAGRTLEAAVARKLEAASIYALLADVYEKSGYVEHAIPTMRLALQLEPSSEKYRFQYGLLLTKADAPAA
ncbi:MAG: tetratricopeptide repeat protein, partial [Casimicrobiaceae bacterium]